MLLGKDLLKSLAVIVASFVVAGSVLWWLRYDIELQSGKAQQIKFRLNRYADSAVLLATLRKQLPQVTTYEDRFSILVPDADKLIEFRNFLGAVGSQRRVSTSFSFQGEGRHDEGLGLSTIGISIDVTGSLTDIQGFLDDIEIHPRSYLFSLDSFSIGKNDTGYRGTFRGKLLYRESKS